MKIRATNGRFIYAGGKESERRDKSCPDCGRMIMRKSSYCRGCAQKGNRGPQWRGGLTNEQKIVRESEAARHWRIAVFERDNYTCQTCGKRGETLHADHIKPFALYPELRFELFNGRTLCVVCHKNTPTFGYKTRMLKREGDVHEFHTI